MLALSLGAEAARLLGRKEDRRSWFRSAFARSRAHAEQSPDDDDAQLDLLLAHANMILVAVGDNDQTEMQRHAQEARMLLAKEIALTGSERDTIDQVRALVDDVLGPPE